MRIEQFKNILLSEMFEDGPNKLWDLKAVKSSKVFAEEKFSQRTLERRISSINWLNSSCNADNLMDENGRIAKQLVIDSLIDNLRKKRQSYLFISLQNITDDQENIHLLVTEDSKGSKKWILLENKEIKTIAEKLHILSENKVTTFFPSGQLVSLMRELKSNAVLEENIHIALNQFHELVSFDQTYNKKEKISPYSDKTKLTHLERLEAESIHIFREVASQAENPVMLYSIGKDSSVMLHLAKKAFYPGSPPFPLLHVDTRWKFKAMYDFRNLVAAESGMELITHINSEGVEKDINPFDHGSMLHTDIMKTQALKQALDRYKFDFAFGGARRDEEKSRAKERIFSFRNENHIWDPKNQRPELWNIYNCKKNDRESIRVFPLSNWTELDIWQYIYQEDIPIVPLYFSAERPVVSRDGILIMIEDDRIKLHPEEKIELKNVRFRTLGCYPLTAAIESSASNLSEIMLELLNSKTSEREGRIIDSDESGSMEKKKKEGYF